MERMDYPVSAIPLPNMELQTEYGFLSFEIKGNEAILNSYRGRDAFVEIPGFVIRDESDECRIPVTGIERKAFLSDKYLAEVVIPNSIGSIGDWCFAGCSSLRRVICPSDAVLGKDVFKDCSSLIQILTVDNAKENIGQEDNKKITDTSFLLVAAHTLLGDRMLFDLAWAGSDEWFDNWDMKMDLILAGHDDEGFVSLVAGGEEDYESEMQTLEGFISAGRKRKVSLCLLRLLYDFGLCDSRKDKLKTFLKEHRAGAVYDISLYENGIGYSDNGYLGRTRTIPIEDVRKELLNKERKSDFNELPEKIRPKDEAWRVVLEEHADEAEYYDLLYDCGCVDSDNIDIMLEDLGDRHARMKALLLGRLETSDNSDYFDNMIL